MTTTKACLAGTALAIFLSLLPRCGSTPMKHDQGQTLSLVAAPATERENTFYTGSRAPLRPVPLLKLPAGAVTPRGWLRGQLEREAAGMTGRLTEISGFLKKEGNAWLSPEGEGHSPWEEVPYWLKGFGDLGYVLKDRKIIAEARVWIEGILASQDASGWFGPRRNLERHDIWPNMIALDCLRSFYEATGDERVIPFMTRYFRFLMNMPRERLLPGSWQKIRGGDNLWSVLWLYDRTGDPFLLDLARVIHERTADWTTGIASRHGVNICQGFREPAEYFLAAKDPVLLEAARRDYDTVMNLYGRVPGGMFGADENCREGFFGPRQGAETCSMVEFMRSFEMLHRITGDPAWADRCEDVAFNSLPAAMTPDLKALHYLTAPNLVRCDGGDKAPGFDNAGCMLAFTPHRYRCCQHNVSHGWPYFAEELWHATPDNGLCASLYAPCEVTARAGAGTRVTIREETEYPFGEKVSFVVGFGAGPGGLETSGHASGLAAPHAGLRKSAADRTNGGHGVKTGPAEATHAGRGAGRSDGPGGEGAEATHAGRGDEVGGGSDSLGAEATHAGRGGGASDGGAETSPRKARFPLYLRIPRWCSAARLVLNGGELPVRPKAGEYVRIERTWQEGDRVVLRLPMEINLQRWEKNGGCVSVSRGPLTYSLLIGERWVKHEGGEAWLSHEKADEKSTPEWPAYEVFPTTPWNYGLVLDEDHPEDSFEVVRRDVGAGKGRAGADGEGSGWTGGGGAAGGGSGWTGGGGAAGGEPAGSESGGGGAGGEPAETVAAGSWTAVSGDRPSLSSGQPFVPGGSPVILRVRARRIPGWTMEGGLVGRMRQSPVLSKEPVETITLIPMGCARLRIAAFPLIGKGPAAHEWLQRPGGG